MNNIQFLFGAFSPNDPDWQNTWNQRLYEYELYTIIFFVVLIAAFTVVTIAIRHQKNQKVRKQLLLARKIGTYLSLIGWLFFVGVGMSLIPLG